MSEKDYTQLFLWGGNVTTIFILLPIIVAIWQRKYLNAPLRVFLLYRIILLLCNLLEQSFVWWVNHYKAYSVPLLTKWDIHDTNFLAILYQLNTVWMIGWFYFLLFPPKPYGNAVRITSIFLCVAILINYLFVEGFRAFGVFNPNATAIFTFSVVALYLFHIYTSHLALPITKNAYFWISAGIILPHLIGFYLFLIGDEAYKQDYGLFVIISLIKNGFTIIGQIFIAIGFKNARYARYLSAKTSFSII